ncbi:MAG: adenylyl-sulfate kinase [Rhodoferax sp.]|nr:adenylyl-sulfate kinase [Rhodoferax sp.]
MNYRPENLAPSCTRITRIEREKLQGHAGMVIWFTGLSGAGKSTLANALEQVLHSRGKHTYLLDGDQVRQGLNRDLGFSDAERSENIRRAAEMARLLMDAGLIVLTAFISPFQADRESARNLIGANHFLEIFVDTPLEVCEQRDPKGLYRKARLGQLFQMTGIHSPYELPTHPQCLHVNGQTDLGTSLAQIMGLLMQQHLSVIGK